VGQGNYFENVAFAGFAGFCWRWWLDTAILTKLLAEEREPRPTTATNQKYVVDNVRCSSMPV
jgi:hypothetical protein